MGDPKQIACAHLSWTLLSVGDSVAADPGTLGNGLLLPFAGLLSAEHCSGSADLLRYPLERASYFGVCGLLVLSLRHVMHNATMIISRQV